ncbi:MAG: DegV family protein [Lachnospiraceae bacterium]
MIKIVTDSASDMPAWIEEKYRLKIIPTPVVINGTDHLDRVSITTKEFYNLLDDKEIDIKTYHINEYMFTESFRAYAQNGDEVLYLCFSTGIAGTFGAATLAYRDLLEEYPDFKMTIVDSHCASLGFGLLVYKLLLMQEQGAPDALIKEAAVYYANNHIKHLFTVNTLYYLIKGGRISKVKGSVGEVLDVKPIIEVDETGALRSLYSVRGRKKALKKLVEEALKNGLDFSDTIVGIVHGEDEESAVLFEEIMREQIKPARVIRSCVGCAIGAHTGRGILGFVFTDRDKEEYTAYQVLGRDEEGISAD